mgnify:CR=1 FL=1
MVTNFIGIAIGIGIALPEKQELAKRMQRACGVGGTVKDGCIEIQGDKRDEVERILVEVGFNPVFAVGSQRCTIPQASRNGGYKKKFLATIED